MAVGTLAVNVVARTMRARKDLKSFRKDVKATDKTVETSVRTFRRWAGSFGAAVAGYASFRVFNQVAADLDRTAKVARKLGVGTNELMGLRHAAEQTAGVTGGTLDMALQRMTRRVAEAAQGTGEAKNALKELGLDAGELNRLSPDQVFARVADAMKGVSGDADKVRLAFKLFDSEGVDLVNTLKEGSEGLRKFQQESRKLHGDLSGENLAKVEAYNDAMDRLKKAVGATGSSIVIEAAPGLTEAADGLTEFLQGMKSFKLPSQARQAVDIGKSYGNFATMPLQWVHRKYRESLPSFFNDDSAGALSASEQEASRRRVAADLAAAKPRTYAEQMSDREKGRQKRVAAARAKARGEAFEAPFNAAFSAVGDAYSSFRKGVQGAKRRFESFEREGFKRAAEVLFTAGRKPLEKSAARLALEQQRDGSFRGDRVNRLVDANSREGYMALRANQRGGGDEAKKHAKKTADSTSRSATAAEQSLAVLRQIGGYFANPPKPASA